MPKTFIEWWRGERFDDDLSRMTVAQIAWKASAREHGRPDRPPGWFPDGEYTVSLHGLGGTELSYPGYARATCRVVGGEPTGPVTFPECQGGVFVVSGVRFWRGDQPATTLIGMTNTVPISVGQTFELKNLSISYF